ncbi:MAG: maltotransferase domain-containing protein, partial [Acidimicrobiales bacterium]
MKLRSAFIWVANLPSPGTATAGHVQARRLRGNPKVVITLGRIAIDDVRPSTPGGEPAKAVAGEELEVSCDLIADGHDMLAGRARWRQASDKEWSESLLSAIGNDRWEAVIRPTSIGPHELVIEAWTDRWATWLEGTEKKLDAGQDVTIELEDGALLLEGRDDPDLAQAV